jgi:hypothetical protein
VAAMRVAGDLSSIPAQADQERETDTHSCAPYALLNHHPAGPMRASFFTKRTQQTHCFQLGHFYRPTPEAPNFVFWDGQHRRAFDLAYQSEVLSKVGFREDEEGGEGRSRLAFLNRIFKSRFLDCSVGWTPVLSRGRFRSH